MTVDDILLALTPGLYSSASKTTFVEIATGRTSSEFFGSDYALAIALRASHMWVLSTYRAGGQAGPVTSESENGQSRSYGSVQGLRNADLAMTSYGLQLLELIKAHGPTMGVVKGPNTPVIPPDSWFPTGGGTGPW